MRAIPVRVRQRTRSENRGSWAGPALRGSFRGNVRRLPRVRPWLRPPARSGPAPAGSRRRPRRHSYPLPPRWRSATIRGLFSSSMSLRSFDRLQRSEPRGSSGISHSKFAKEVAAELARIHAEVCQQCAGLFRRRQLARSPVPDDREISQEFQFQLRHWPMFHAAARSL